MSRNRAARTDLSSWPGWMNKEPEKDAVTRIPVTSALVVKFNPGHSSLEISPAGILVSKTCHAVE